VDPRGCGGEFLSEAASEFVRGWRVVAGSLLGISVGVSSIYFYSLGVFIKPLAAEFGWGRGTASLGALVGTAGAALMAIPVGGLVDRMGSTKVAVGSIFILSLGFLSLGIFTASLGSFLLITFLLSLLTAGSSPLPYTRLVVTTFDRSRGLALGITLAGTGIGALLIPTFLTSFVSSHGWRAGYYVLASICAAGVPLVFWLLAPSKEAAVRAPNVGAFHQAAHSSTFWLLVLIFFFASFSILGTLVHFVPMLTDWGLTPLKAGANAGLIGLAAIGGRMVVGALLDRAPPLLVTGGIFLMVACGLSLLATLGAPFSRGAALVLGCGVGAEADLMAFLIARYFSKAQYGQVYGALYAAFLLGGALGPAASGYLQQATGDYRSSLYGASAVLIIAMILTLLLTRVVARPVSIVDAALSRVH
jgi:MFS family permease